MVPGGKPGSPAACSGWKCVVVRKSFWLPGAVLAATRAAVAPFLGPIPVSTTSVARFPTTMAMLGKPMIAQTWSEIFVVFSPTGGCGICAMAPPAVRTASVRSIERDFIVFPLYYEIRSEPAVAAYLIAMVAAIWPGTDGLSLGMLFISTMIGTAFPGVAVIGI